MFCPNCGTNLPDGSAFCGNCGTSVGAGNTAANALTAAGMPATQYTAESGGGDKLLEMVKAELGRDYRIERELGRGGMAVVYKGVEMALERQVALKVVPPENANASQAAERFRREAKLAASLDHPNIIPVYRVGQAGPLHYMAMKFVEGRAVDAIIEQQGALPINIVVAILRAAATGLAFAHERKIVHRDIKPANILVDKDGRVMVSDFGIARALEEVSMTASGMMVGTPYYMSPEQCGGQKVSPQSDQYSLGIMGFQMITGDVPFIADSMVGVIQHHYMTPVPDILAVREGVPKELVDIIYCALNKDPNDRFPTTKDMAVALDNIPVTDPDREEAEAILRQLSAGEAIPRIRTGTLPPLNLTISGPGPRVQPRPVTQPRARMTATSTGMVRTRRRKKKNKAVLAAGVVMVVGLGSSSGYLIQRQNEADRIRAADSIAAAEQRDLLARGRVVISGLPKEGTIAIGGRLFRNGQTFAGDTGVTYVGTATAPGKARLDRPFQVRGGAVDTLLIGMIDEDKAGTTVATANVQQQQQQRARPPEEVKPVIVDSSDVRFVVLPPHSDIYVNGKLIGKGRFLQRRVPVGTNSVRYQAPGCDPEEFKIDVFSGATVQILPPRSLTCR
jgi:serine/threonine protein kinase